MPPHPREARPNFADYPHRSAWCAPAAGGPDLGVIPQDAALALGVHPGPIRLRDGVPTSFGYGRRHIETNPSRLRLIRDQGFADVLDFVTQVAVGWDRLFAAEDGRIQVAFRRGGYDHKIVLSWEPPCWSVVTGLPVRPINQPVLFTRKVVAG